MVSIRKKGVSGRTKAVSQKVAAKRHQVRKSSAQRTELRHQNRRHTAVLITSVNAAVRTVTKWTAAAAVTL